MLTFLVVFAVFLCLLCLSVVENILNREFTASIPGAKWVSDLTYLRTTQGWLYLCIIIDLWDRKVLGWFIGY